MLEEDLRIMRRIDELHLEHPLYAARRLAKQLEREGFNLGRVHVATLMRRMGIEALCRRPRTSIPARDAKIYRTCSMGWRSSAESGVVVRSHLFADCACVFVLDGDLGRDESQSAVISGFTIQGCGLHGDRRPATAIRRRPTNASTIALVGMLTDLNR